MRNRTDGPGRCGQCHTTKRPVAHYAEGFPFVHPDPRGRWLCDRCVVNLRLENWELTAWGTEQRVSAIPTAEPSGGIASLPDGTAARDTGAEPWADDADADDEDDRALRLAEARHLSDAISRVLVHADTSERPGLLRALDALLARRHELGED